MPNEGKQATAGISCAEDIVAFPKRRLEIDNGDEPVPVYVVNSHNPWAGAFLHPLLS